MPYLIGIDGGGTKTLGVLTDVDGRVKATATERATNPNDVTPAISAERLTSLCLALLEQAGLTRESLAETSLFFGLAGGINHGPAMERMLKEIFPEAMALRVRSDAHILLSGEIPTGDGVCIICDWEASGYSKPNSLLNAYETCKKYHPDKLHIVEPLLKKGHLL